MSTRAFISVVVVALIGAIAFYWVGDRWGQGKQASANNAKTI